MKPEDQIKALAELDGWKRSDGDVNAAKMFEEVYGHPIIDAMLYPDYLTSYDAIIPLIRKVIVHINDIEKFMDSCLMDMSGEHFNDICFQVFTKTPAQLCEALLRVTGKWKE